MEGREKKTAQQKYIRYFNFKIVQDNLENVITDGFVQIRANLSDAALNKNTSGKGDLQWKYAQEGHYWWSSVALWL